MEGLLSTGLTPSGFIRAPDTQGLFKGEQVTAELGGNTDANHSCTRLFFFNQTDLVLS